MRKKLMSSLILAVMILGFVVSSCSKKGELLDSIPANVNAVAVMDVKGVLENAGCKFTAEGLELSASLKNADIDDDIFKVIGKLNANNASDLSDVAIVVDAKRNMAVTFLVNDVNKFKEITEDCDWDDGENGYEEGSADNAKLLLDDHQCWIVLAGNPYEMVKALRDEAKKEPITRLAGVTGVLESDNLFNFAMSTMTFGSTDNNVAQQETVWNVMSANVKENKIVAESRAMKGDGEVIKVKGMQPINPAVLAYLPANFNFALAAGLTPEFDWKAVIGAITPMFANNFQMQGALAMLTPFLQSLDGTVVLAAGPANDDAYDDVNPENWQFVMMAHMPQERINQMMNMIKSTLAQNGIAPKSERDGVMTIPQYGMDFYVGNVDGYLAIANIPFENTRNNSLAPMFVNKDAALCIDLPSLNLLSPAAPSYGLKVDVNMQGSEGKAEISLPGAKYPVLETILATIYGE